VNPGGPLTPDTRCLICRKQWKRDGSMWLWFGPDQSTEVFAGYFCGSTCAEVWNDADEVEKYRIIFGDPMIGIDLMERAERGDWETDPDAPTYVPLLADRPLGVDAARIYEVDSVTGDPVRPLPKLARFLWVGRMFREAARGGPGWRKW
jgi:hypothetical protein